MSILQLEVNTKLKCSGFVSGLSKQEEVSGLLEQPCKKSESHIKPAKSC